MITNGLLKGRNNAKNYGSMFNPQRAI